MNILNGRQVEVLINDRGPFIGGRVIDLSHAAAKKLDMIDLGTSPVTIEVITDEMSRPRGRFRPTSTLGSNERSALISSQWARGTPSPRWGWRYGDVWISPREAQQNHMEWPHARDLRDERRLRRLSQFSEDFPHPAELPADEEATLPEAQNCPIAV